MMHVIKCDWCKKEAPRNEDVPLNWFILEHGIERYGVRPGPWHLHSWECVSLFAASRSTHKDG